MSAARDDSELLAVERTPDGYVMVASGAWTVEQAARIDAALVSRREELAPEGGRAIFRLEALERLDTVGAWLIHRTLREFEERGVATELAGGTAERMRLVNEVGSACFDRELPPAPAPDFLVRQVERVGRASVEGLREAAALLSFFGELVLVAGRGAFRPWRIRWTSVVHHLHQTGLNAMPIVGLMAALIGIVLAFQGSSQLTRFGADIFTVNLLGVSILREIGVLLTAIIVAGRSGSAFTAQIGTMKVNEEVDALRTLGLDPMELLVLPRMLALMLALPLLAFFADIMGLVGGAVTVVLMLNIPLAQFMTQLEGSIDTGTLWIGLAKAPIFALVIALVGCRNGLRVSGDAESVGRRTTESVVVGIFLVIVIDAAFSVLFQVLGI